MQQTVFLGDVAIHKTQCMSFLDDLPGILASSVVMGCNRNNFLTNKFASSLLELLLFWRQLYKKLIKVSQTNIIAVLAELYQNNIRLVLHGSPQL
jgi:hypothetical protein